MTMTPEQKKTPQNQVLDLDNLAYASEQPGQDKEIEVEPIQVQPVIRPVLQLMLRLCFTAIGLAYFLLTPKIPLFITRGIVPWVCLGIAVFFIFCFIKIRKGEKTGPYIQAGYIMDACAGLLAWLCDPMDPPPMMMLILVVMIGNSIHHGFKVFKELFAVTMLAAPMVFAFRLYHFEFNLVPVLFFGLCSFLIIYFYLLNHQADSLYKEAEKRTGELLFANARMKKTGRALQESEARYKAMFQHSGSAMVLIQDDMTISMVNTKFEELCGYPKQLICNRMKLTDFIPAEDIARIRRIYLRRRALGWTKPAEYECKLIDRNKNTKFIIIKFDIIAWHERIIVTLVDITSIKLAKAALERYNIRLQQITRKLQESELRYRNLFENTGTATIMVGKNMKISMANSKFCEMTGYSKEEIIGKKRLTEFIERKNLNRIRRFHARQKEKGLPPPTEYECLIIDKSREMKHVVMNVYTPPGQESSIVSFFDITSRKQAEAALQKAHEKLKLLSVMDELTQLANRRRFDEYLEKEWNRHSRYRLPLSLIMCDVDCFKRYNDTYGHQAGDKCLQEIAAVLRRNIKRTVDLVARYGGEEFAVIMPNTDAKGALKVAETIRIAVEQLQIPHSTSLVSPFVTLSLGVGCIIPDHDKTQDTLIREADQALYEAKRKGRNRTVLGDDARENFEGDKSPSNVIILT